MGGRRHFEYLTQCNKSINLTSTNGMYTVDMSLYKVISKIVILLQEFSKSVQKYRSYSDLNIFKMATKRLL